MLIIQILKGSSWFTCVVKKTLYHEIDTSDLVKKADYNATIDDIEKNYNIYII